MLALYTDGINEAMDPADKQFSIDRIRNHLRGPLASPQALGEAIITDVRQFMGPRAQFDDMCLVCLRRSP